MRVTASPRSAARALRGASVAVLAVLFATGVALAQSSPFGTASPPGAQPTRLPDNPAQSAVPNPIRATLERADLIARVEGRPISKEQFDALAGPYIAQVRAQMGAGFTNEVMRVARQNAFDELVRHEVLAVESERQKIPVNEAETDSVLRQDPMLQTNGKLDPVKLQEFKLNPQSNYFQLLPRLREFAAVAKLERQLRERFTPSRAEVRAEFEKRAAQVRFSFLALQLRDISLEPESTGPEWEAYYKTHPGEFMKRARIRLRYYHVSLPAATDSTRAPAESLAFARGRRMADSLRAGTLADSSAESQDTGLFDVGTPVVPGLGRSPELAAAVAQADTVPSLRVLGPFRLPEAVIVAAVVERQAKQPQPFLEALGNVKRRADAEKRKAVAEADRRTWFDANRDRYKAVRATLTRVRLSLAAFKERDIPAPELDRWYQSHGRTLYGMPDSSKSWLPPVTDSLRRIVRARMLASEREHWAGSTMEKLAAGLGADRALAALARANSAVVETLSLVRAVASDSVFTPAVVDSILTGAMAEKGLVRGPRRLGRYSVAWRVDAADTAYVPPFEAVRSRVEMEFTAEKEKKDEAEGRTRYEQHRSEYVPPVKYTIDYVAVPIPPADSIRLSDADLKAEYQKNIATYRQDEQVHARHLLLSTREGGPDLDAKTKARADSLLAAIKRGADFADLAKRFSQDPGSASTGGDLGWFGHGRMVPEFEHAAFALKPGELSPVVRTAFGYHIIKLEERKAAGMRAFEEVRNDIRTALASARADTSARKAAEALRRRLALAADPKSVAAPYGGLESPPSFAANEAVSGLGFVQGLSTDLTKLAAGRWAPTIYRSGRSFVVLRPGHTIPSRPADFDEARVQAIQDVMTAKRQALLDQKVAAIRAALAAGAKLDSLAAPYGGLKDSGPVSPNFGFLPGLGPQPRLVQQAFAAKPGEVSDTLQVTQGVAWFRVESHNPGDPKAFESLQAQITQELLKRRYDPWLDERKRTLRVEILDPEFRVARRPPARVGAATGG